MKKRNCVLTIRFAHGITDPEGSLVNDFKERKWRKVRCGDGVGYVGCVANQLNAEIKKRYPNVAIPVPPSDPDPVSSEHLAIVNNALGGVGLTLPSADYQTISDLAPSYDAARKEALNRCNENSCCQRVTVRVSCTSATAYQELKELALQYYDPSDISKAIKRLKSERPNEILCGKSTTLDCKTGGWTKLN